MTKWIFRLQILVLVLMVIGVGAFRFEQIAFPLLAKIFAATALVLVLLALLALLLLLVSVFARVNIDRGSAASAVGVMLLPVLAIMVTVGSEGFKVPPIHDISTDMENPPVFTAMQEYRRRSDNTLDYPGESVAQLQRQAYPHIQPLELDVEPAQAYLLARQKVLDLGWRLIAERPGLGELEALDVSAVFGFKDDVIIRISPIESGSRFDVRSVSRVGRSDLGANARRIERFFNALRSKN